MSDEMPPLEMCSGSEAGLYSRLIDFGYHSTLGLRVIQKKEDAAPGMFGHARQFFLTREVPRGEKMLYSGTDPASYITEYTLV